MYCIQLGRIMRHAEEDPDLQRGDAKPATVVAGMRTLHWRCKRHVSKYMQSTGNVAFHVCGTSQISSCPRPKRLVANFNELANHLAPSSCISGIINKYTSFPGYNSPQPHLSFNSPFASMNN